jgi:hypothetical protein
MRIIIFIMLVLFCSPELKAHDSNRNYGMDMLNGCDNTFWSVYSAGVFPLHRGYRIPRMHFRGYRMPRMPRIHSYYPDPLRSAEAEMERIYKYNPNKCYIKIERRPPWHFGN